MSMFTVENYISSIKSTLDKQTDLLVKKLKKVLQNNLSSKIDLLDFTAFIEPTRFELSIIMFTMDKEGNEVFNNENDSNEFASSMEVLPEVEYYQLNDKLLDSFFNFYEENEETIIPLEQNLFADWFKVSWEKAGGKTIKLPSYFTVHDEYKSFDLKNGTWIDDEEKWS